MSQLKLCDETRLKTSYFIQGYEFLLSKCKWWEFKKKKMYKQTIVRLKKKLKS